MIRSFGNGNLIDLLIKCRGRNGEIRLADHENAIGHVRQLAQLLTLALNHSCTADHTERHIAANLCAQFRQSQNGQGIAIVVIQSPQNRSRIRTATAHSRFHRNPLGDTDLQTVGIFIQGIAVNLRCFPCKIPLIRRNTFLGAKQLPRLTCSHVDFNIITNGEGLHDTFQVMITVLPLVQHIQRKIHFRICAFIQCFHK